MPQRAVLALFLLTSPARAQQPGESNVAALAAADSAAHAWLALLGAGGYVASWQTASPHMKQRIREQDWTLLAEAYRDQFARSERRKTVDSRYQRSVPPNPPAEYATFRYVTTLTPERMPIMAHRTLNQ